MQKTNTAQSVYLVMVINIFYVKLALMWIGIQGQCITVKGPWESDKCWIAKKRLGPLDQEKPISQHMFYNV